MYRLSGESRIAAWQYMMGMENDDYDMYNYENVWKSPRKINIKQHLRQYMTRLEMESEDDDSDYENARQLYDVLNEWDSSDSDY